MFNVDALMSNGLVLVPLITGLVQLVKMAMPEKYFKYSGFLAVIFAILLSLLFNNHSDGYNWQQAIAQGLIVGLASSGLYSIGKTSIQNGEKTID
jgi:hypothetical protein